MNELLPPMALEAEQSILGGLMQDSRIIDDVLARISKEDFYKTIHQNIYQVIRDMAFAGEQVDVITVAEKIQNANIENSGDLPYLASLVKNTPKGGDLISYAKIVKDRSGLRKLIEFCNDAIGKAYNPQGESVDTIIDQAGSSITSIMETSTNLQANHISDHLSEYVDQLEKRSTSDSSLVGLPCGFDSLDKVLLGLEGGEVYVIAARPSMGKTAFSMNMAHRMGLNGGKSLFISMEMPVSQLINRMVASYGVDHGAIRKGDLSTEDWPRVTHAMGQLKQSGIFVDETPSLSVPKISAIAKGLFKREGKMPIFIDYLQIMGSDGNNKSRYEEVTKFSMQIKALAKVLDVPIILLSQLSRNLESRKDKRPINSDLRESGAIEQDAGAIMFLHREEVYDKETALVGFAEVIISKNRNGECKTVPLSWEGQYQRFNDLSAQDFNRFVSIQSRENEAPTFKGGLK